MRARKTRNPVALVVHTHGAVRRALCDRIKAAFAHFQLCEAASTQAALFLLDEVDVDIILIEGEGGGVDALQGMPSIGPDRFDNRDLRV